MNRTIQPDIKEITEVKIKQVVKTSLSNGIDLVSMNAGSQELLRIEYVFKAGTREQKYPLIAAFANEMLLEGTSTMTGKEISDKVDFYGGFMNIEISKDNASLQVFVLAKFLDKVLPVIKDCITDSVFPEKEFEVIKQNKKSKYIVNLEKVDYICRQKFTELIFENSPYGPLVSLTNYDELSIEDVREFYKEYYQEGSLEVLVSGNISDQSQSIITNHLNSFGSYNRSINTEFNKGDFTPQQLLIEREGAVQSAIRIGRPMFDMNHEDYHQFKVLNVLLGGYFGSRLMSNIREDKGYTYGIGSGLISFENDGLFLIASEVGADVCAPALKEIYFEIKRLQTELVPNEELDLVRNYMLGNMLRNMEGPFDLMERYKEIEFSDKGYDYYDEYISVIKTVTSQDIQDLANKYLKKSDLLELVVGKIN